MLSFKVQLTREQHEFELHGSMYTLFFPPRNILNHFFEVYDHLKKLVDEPCSLEVVKKIKES